ncbi:General alpha-glucoside permease [Zancudomyces culisetae]|uniref:General alpha-glucoside permease n=1 Tax=Zancudomyces culisetae TaxID=1213189 RepID=A0A1R1PK33_ZANCU|nr:General alpha-glucoside permease [Zancudomyces culisetae]|eukprot:OMH81325.1 General alpha-glucoside permease [Zancudomyces culisetae]
MYLTLLVSTSYIAVTMLLMTLGFCWAVTIWIPYALIGHCLSLNQHDGNREQTNFKSPNPDEYVRLDTEHASEIHNNIDPMNYSNRLSTESEYSSIINGTIHSNSSNDVGSSNSRSGNHPASGAILGAHNIFIVLPQLITAVFSSLVFLFFEKTNDGYADYMSIGHLFRICGTFPLIAAYLCYKY